MAIRTMEEKVLTALGELYGAEQHALEGLRSTAEQGDDALKTLFQQHVTQSEGQVARLEQAYAAIGVEPQAQKLALTGGLVEDVRRAGRDAATRELQDCLRVARALVGEQVEITLYQSLIGAVRRLETPWAGEVGDLLHQNLQEEQGFAARLQALEAPLARRAQAVERGEEPQALATPPVNVDGLAEIKAQIQQHRDGTQNG